MTYTFDIIDALIEYYLGGEKHSRQDENPKLYTLIAELDELAEATKNIEFRFAKEELCKQYDLCPFCGGRLEREVAYGTDRVFCEECGQIVDEY